MQFLKFIGALLASVVFVAMVDLYHFLFFVGASHFFANFSWSSLFSFDVLRGLLLPLGWTVMWLIALGTRYLINGKRWMTIIPILLCLLGLFHGFDILFLHPWEKITSEIGTGSWYYFGAILTYIEMIVFYVVFAFMLYPQDDF